jgi:hypothetical protein
MYQRDNTSIRLLSNQVVVVVVVDYSMQGLNVKNNKIRYIIIYTEHSRLSYYIFCFEYELLLCLLFLVVAAVVATALHTLLL